MSTFIDSFGFKNTKDLIKAKPVNLIIGDNGSGKSTLVERIYAAAKADPKDNPMAVRTLGYSENPLDKIQVNFNSHPVDAVFISGSYETTRSQPSYFSDNMLQDIQQMKSSSGEGVLIGIASALQKIKDGSVIVLDEPEKGLDIKRQIQMSGVILSFAKKRNCQLFVATHSLAILKFMQSCENRENRVSLSMCNELSIAPCPFSYIDIMFVVLNDDA